MPPDQIRKVLTEIGLPQKKTSKLSVSQLNALFDVIVDCSTRAPSGKSFDKLAKAILAAGFTPGEMAAMDMSVSKRPAGKGNDSWPF